MPSKNLRGTLLAGEGDWGRVLGGRSSQRAAGMGGSHQITASPRKTSQAGWYLGTESSDLAWGAGAERAVVCKQGRSSGPVRQ